MLTLIDFYADWCGPCRAIKPVIEAVMKGYEGKVELKKIDVDQNLADAQKYGVINIPTLLLLKDGNEVDRKVGLLSEEALKSWLDANL